MGISWWFYAGLFLSLGRRGEHFCTKILALAFITAAQAGEMLKMKFPWGDFLFLAFPASLWFRAIQARSFLKAAQVYLCLKGSVSRWNNNHEERLSWFCSHRAISAIVTHAFVTL